MKTLDSKTSVVFPSTLTNVLVVVEHLEVTVLGAVRAVPASRPAPRIDAIVAMVCSVIMAVQWGHHKRDVLLRRSSVSSHLHFQDAPQSSSLRWFAQLKWKFNGDIIKGTGKHSPVPPTPEIISGSSCETTSLQHGTGNATPATASGFKEITYINSLVIGGSEVSDRTTRVPVQRHIHRSGYLLACSTV